MKNILVTGGAGYIGSHAVKMLQKEGYNVIIIDNLSTGVRFAVSKEATFYELSIHDEDQVYDVLIKEHVDAVLHFAAFSLVGESVENPLKYYHNNIEGTRALLSALQKANVNTFIFSSTAAVYGEQKVIPIKETAPLAPTNPYGVTKKAIEDMLKDLSKANPNFHYASLRYFNVAGSYHDGSIGENHNPETHLIPNVIKSVLNQNQTLKLFGTDYPTKDGTAIRDYIHVEDLIDAHIKALQYIHKQKTSEIFNLGSAEGYSVLDIINVTKATLNLDVPYEVHARRPGDPPILIASHQKAKDVLGWTPKRSLENMIQSATKYFKSI